MRRKVEERIIRPHEFMRHGYLYRLVCGHEVIAYPRWKGEGIVHPKSVTCPQCSELYK